MFLDDVFSVSFGGAGPDDGAVLYECRHCGSKFDEYREECSTCGVEEIASYEFETGDVERNE